MNLVYNGHPVHAALTDIPASLIPAGFLFSLLGRMTDEPTLEAAGFLNTAAGVAAAAPTAVSGLTDYLQMEVDDPAWITGLVHGLLNLAAVGCGLASLVDRRRTRRSTPRSLWLSGVAAGILTASAYLGGDLVYHRGWRVTPVEREEIANHRVPDTVRDDDFLLRSPARSVRLSSAGGSPPSA